MIDYSGNIVSTAAVRGPSQTLIINELHSLTRLTMTVFKMNNNINTKVVDFRRRKILTKMTRMTMMTPMSIMFLGISINPPRGGCIF